MILRDEIFCKLAGHAEPLRAALHLLALYSVYPEYTPENTLRFGDKAIKEISSAGGKMIIPDALKLFSVGSGAPKWTNSSPLCSSK